MVSGNRTRVAECLTKIWDLGRHLYTGQIPSNKQEPRCTDCLYKGGWTVGFKSWPVDRSWGQGFWHRDRVFQQRVVNDKSLDGELMPRRWSAWHKKPPTISQGVSSQVTSGKSRN